MPLAKEGGQVAQRDIFLSRNLFLELPLSHPSTHPSLRAVGFLRRVEPLYNEK